MPIALRFWLPWHSQQIPIKCLNPDSRIGFCQLASRLDLLWFSRWRCPVLGYWCYWDIDIGILMVYGYLYWWYWDIDIGILILVLILGYWWYLDIDIDIEILILEYWYWDIDINIGILMILGYWLLMLVCSWRVWSGWSHSTITIWTEFWLMRWDSERRFRRSLLSHIWWKENASMDHFS